MKIFTDGKSPFFPKIAIFILWSQGSPFILQEKPSALKREHPALFQNLKIFHFFSIFIGIFCPP
jgi:hypothetical protein